MLGYFSLVGLLRLHSLLGDYYQAIKVLENIELNKKVPFYLATVAMPLNTRSAFCVSSPLLLFFCLPEHVLSCARVPDYHLLLRWFCLLDDEALPGCYSGLRQHPALHPEDQKYVPEVNLQIWDGEFAHFFKIIFQTEQQERVHPIKYSVNICMLVVLDQQAEWADARSAGHRSHHVPHAHWWEHSHPAEGEIRRQDAANAERVRTPLALYIKVTFLCFVVIWKS